MITKGKVITIFQIISRWSVYSIIFFIPIFFAWFQENYSVFDLNKSVALHFLFAIGFSAWLLEVTLSGKLKWRGNKWFGLLGIILAAWFIITTIFSIHPILSLWGSYERFQGLYNLLHYLGFTFLIVVSLRSYEDVAVFIKSFLFGSIFAIGYGLIQFFGLDPLHWGEETNRLFSSFGQPNFFGHYLAVILPLTVYILFCSVKNIYSRLFYSILLVGQIFCFLFTYSRAAWISVGVTVILLFLWLLGYYHKKKLLLLTSVACVIGVIFFSFILISQKVSNTDVAENQQVSYRLFSVLETKTGSNKARLNYWGAGIQAWLDSSLSRKLIGYGPDTQATVYAPYYRPTWAYDEKLNSFPDRAHNFILDIVLQFGVIGLIIFGFFSGYIGWQAYKAIRNTSDYRYRWLLISLFSALCIYGLNNLLSFSLVAMNVVLYGLLGITWLASRQFRVQESVIKLFQPLSRWLITGSSMLLLLILLYNYNFKLYIADYYYFKVKKAEQKGDCQAVLQNLDAMTAWYPLNQAYNRAYLHHVTNCFSAIDSPEDYKNFGRALLEQISLIPEKERQFYTLINISHSYSIMGFYVDKKYYQDAEKVYQHMLEIDPYITTTYQDYGRMKLWAGEPEEARAIFQQGINVLPPLNVNQVIYHRQGIVDQLAYFYNLIATSYSDQGNYEEAVVWFEKSLTVNASLPSTYQSLADTYRKAGEVDQAIEATKKAFRLDRTNSLWMLNLAVLYKEKGDREVAKKYIGEALVMSPDDKTIQALAQELGVE